MKTPIPKTVMRELEQAGVAWSLVKGGRHYKLLVGDRLAGILPYGKSAGQTADRTAEFNMRAQVRRIIKDVRT